MKEPHRDKNTVDICFDPGVREAMLIAETHENVSFQVRRTRSDEEGGMDYTGWNDRSVRLRSGLCEQRKSDCKNAGCRRRVRNGEWTGTSAPRQVAFRLSGLTVFCTV